MYFWLVYGLRNLEWSEEVWSGLLLLLLMKAFAPKEKRL